MTDAPERRVEVRLDDRAVLQSPAEGLWSVATAWRDDWPADWQHARPDRVETSGEWTVLSGGMDLPGGRLALRDACRAEDGVIRVVRRFTWQGTQTLSNCTLSARWQVPGVTNARPLLPGILYYGNPSGARTGPGNVVVHTGRPGDESIFEEHRYAAPFACVEWREAEAARSAALHTLPSRVPDGRYPDQWWSLGVVARAADTELVLLSGPCAANGRHSVVKGQQRKFSAYPEAWMSLRPGAVVEKTFFLEAVPASAPGSGFRQPLRTAMALHAPYALDGLPAARDIVRDKYRFALSRFRDREKDPGFEMFPDSHGGTDYVMGWCGQAEALGHSLIRLAPQLDDPKAQERAVRSMNHLATSPFNDRGFQQCYSAESGKWSQQDPVSQGQAMENFFRAVLAGRAAGGIDTKPWEEFLRKACALQAARILRDDWRPVSTAEGFYVSPLCQAFALFGQEEFKRAALKAAAHYAQRHLDMTEPYWGGTLDARCEDKEGALAGFQAFLAVYEMTKDPKHLEWAAHALDVALTYTVLWDIDLPPSRLRDHALKTRGWTIVSAQNQHLDVYAVLFTPEIWRMGELLGRDDLKKLAAVMFRSCGQLIDPFGSQGEQIHHTNFGQAGDVSDVFRQRGGYSEGWTVFWITAHFLNAAAQFQSMGVDLDRIDAAAGLACAQAPARPAMPLVFAHRGASGERPEHTLGAYRLAMEQGADFVEPDLRMTRDGVFIALHDATLNRTTDVEARPDFAARARVDTNGVKRWCPEDFTLAEIKMLRTRQGTKGRSAKLDLQESIPTLAEVVALVRDFNRASGRTVGLVPELRGHAGEFVRFVTDHALDGPAGPPLYLQSFELDTLKQVRPHLHAPCAWLLGDRPTAAQLTDLKGVIDAFAVSKKAVLEEGAAEWIRAAHAQGFAVIAWTFADDSFARKQFANPGDDLALALANGVDAFFTDHPASGVRVRATFLKAARP